MTIPNCFMISTTVDLFLAFSKLLTKKKEEFRQNHTTIVKDEYKIEDLMDQLRHRCPRSLTSSLAGLVSRSQRISKRSLPYFLQPLELIKIQEVTVIQDRGFWRNLLK